MKKRGAYAGILAGAFLASMLVVAAPSPASAGGGVFFGVHSAPRHGFRHSPHRFGHFRHRHDLYRHRFFGHHRHFAPRGFGPHRHDLRGFRHANQFGFTHAHQLHNSTFRW